MQATALIAEDEALLAASLAAELARAWPGLTLLATVGHGAAAVEQALSLRPDVLFLDIRMPGMSGLEAAQALAEDWPEGEPLPLMVFVTAYDQYALQAFEHAATATSPSRSTRGAWRKPVRDCRQRWCCVDRRRAQVRRSTTTRWRVCAACSLPAPTCPRRRR